MKQPLVWSSLGWITGSLLCHWGWKSVSLYAGLAVGISVLGAWFFYQYRKGLLVTLFLVGLSVGAARYAYAEVNNHSAIAAVVGSNGETAAVITGEIVSRPQVDGDRLLFDIKVRQLADGRIRWRIPEEEIKVTVRLQNETEWLNAHQFQRYWKIETLVVLERPSPARNPGAFDYRAYLYRQQIHWLAKGESLDRVKILSADRDHLFVWMDRLREELGSQIERIYSPAYAGLIRGMLLGERERVDAEMEAAYSTLGIVHLLSISGLHVGVLVACLYFLLKQTGLTREKAALLVILALPFYVILTGAEAPVIRAAIMAGLSLLAVLFGRWKELLSFMALSLLIQLAWNPYQIFEPGFQLTFLVTGALIIGVEPIARQLPFPWHRLNQGIAVALVAQVVSFPVLIYHFYEFSFLSWFANLLFVPVISSLVIPVSTAALLLGFVHETAGRWLAGFSSLLLDLVHKGTDLLLEWSWAHVTWVPPTLLWVLLYSLAAIYLWISWAGNLIFPGRHRMLSGLCFICLVAVAHQAHLWGKDEARIAFLDVGQGDCTVIETPEGKVILVDGGGTPFFPRKPWQIRRDPFEVGKRIVVPYLKYRGIRQIDELVITHGDTDHIGGLLAVAERFPVRRVIRNPHPPGSQTEKRLLQTLAKKGTRIYTLSPGVSWEVEPGIKWKFFHPDPSRLIGTNEKSNNDSVVFLLSVFQMRIMMTGDMEREAESKVLSEWALPTVDLLKVAHHGSRTSTQAKWLQVLKPRQAIISVGRENRYGHPAPEVLQRLQAIGAAVLRTDRHGAVTVKIRPEGIRTETMLQP
ncbi:DNA internalization-related competence protein ComEC/Rec2 [Lihuaxuella thermophila]|uniref:DNA internalization-related competence protein ComEC/Rec2 n=1 Tax=Lihuaxuella thermophila TaxID=1173111 RepID=UPI00147DBC48|nr:DNA internalization-related competence protein ComEC/Rec2 [Lihuaxuella thermophila]